MVVFEEFAGITTLHLLVTGSPETFGQQWPMFTAEGKETMLFDERSEWKSEPFREIYAIMKKICPAFE